MERKSPGYVKLMARSRNSANIPRASKDIKTASSLFMTSKERESLGAAMDLRKLGPEARREKDKFARQDKTIEKFKANYFKAREKLAGTRNKNLALMELRYELQQRRRDGEEPAIQASNSGEVKAPAGKKGFNHVELRY